MNACLFFIQIVLNFRNEGMLDRHAFGYLGRTLLCTVGFPVSPFDSRLLLLTPAGMCGDSVKLSLWSTCLLGVYVYTCTNFSEIH